MRAVLTRNTVLTHRLQLIVAKIWKEKKGKEKKARFGVAVLAFLLPVSLRCRATVRFAPIPTQPTSAAFSLVTRRHVTP